MDLSMFNLQNRTALITGGNTGIGLGLARGLAGAGAHVAITGRHPQKLDKALTSLRELDPQAEGVIFDLENLRGIPDFYADISARLGGVDILVNNAGGQLRGRADEIDLDDFQKLQALNVTAPYVLSQQFARERIAQSKPGAVIMIGSLMCEASRPTTSAYTASKGAIRQLVKALAIDWAPFGIRVNGIGPGYIQTGMTQVLVEKPEFDAWVKQRTPLGRWGQPDDFAGTAVFLASDASAFITGQMLYVDGGWLATF